jgi:hypothetical protein
MSRRLAEIEPDRRDIRARPRLTIELKRAGELVQDEVRDRDTGVVVRMKL